MPPIPRLQSPWTAPRPDPFLRRARRAAVSLQASGLMAPVAGLAVLAGSVWVMSAAAAAWPEAAALAPDPGSCNPLRGDFGCGHGLGCACHLLPAATPQDPAAP